MIICFLFRLSLVCAVLTKTYTKWSYFLICWVFYRLSDHLANPSLSKALVVKCRQIYNICKNICIHITLTIHIPLVLPKYRHIFGFINTHADCTRTTHIQTLCLMINYASTFLFWLCDGSFYRYALGYQNCVLQLAQFCQ